MVFLKEFFEKDDFDDKNINVKSITEECSVEH